MLQTLPPPPPNPATVLLSHPRNLAPEKINPPIMALTALTVIMAIMDPHAAVPGFPSAADAAEVPGIAAADPMASVAEEVDAAADLPVGSEAGQELAGPTALYST